VDFVRLRAPVRWPAVTVRIFLQRLWHARGTRCLVTTLLLENHVSPGLSRSNVLADTIGKHLHPAVFLLPVVGVEVNDLAVAETNAESFLNEHVAFLVLGKARLATTTRLGSRRLFECTLVVEQLGCLGKVDGSTRLPCRLVVSGEFCAVQTEEATAPELVWLAIDDDG
jgi:hypothetical protein